MPSTIGSIVVDRLDEQTVTFAWLDPGNIGGTCTITLDRKKWEEMGRPGSLRLDISEGEQIVIHSSYGEPDTHERVGEDVARGVRAALAGGTRA